MVGTLPLYRSGQTYTLPDSRPPVANDLDDGEVGAIFRVQTSEGGEQQFAIVEIRGRKYLQPWNTDTGAVTQYLSGGTYRVGVYPNQTTVQADVILDWGEIKQISEIKGGRLSWKRYDDQITGWVPGDIWVSQESVGEETDINWSDYSNWNNNNPNGFLAWGTTHTIGADNSFDGLAVSEITYRNFGGVDGLTFQVIYTSSPRFDGQVNIDASRDDVANVSPKPEFKDKEPKHIDNGIEFTIPAGHFFTYNFRFASSPVWIDSIDILGSSTARTGVRFASGLLRWRPFQSLRRDTPKIQSDYFFGPVQEYEVFESPQGWPAGPIDNPIAAGAFRITQPCDGFSIYVDNRQFTADTVFRLTNWKIRPIMLGNRYQVEFDIANNRFIGVPLIIGNPIVILTDQNKRGGWVRSEAHVYDQNFPPTIGDDRLGGFYAGQSEWGTNNDVIYRLKSDEIDEADWFLQNAAAISHPFSNIKLQSYPILESRSLRTNPLDDDLKGFYGYLGNTTGFSFSENRSFISVLNQNLVNRGYAVPAFQMSIDDNKTNVTISGGDPSRFRIYTEIYDLIFVFTRDEFPAEITQNRIYISRNIDADTNDISYPYRVYTVLEDSFVFRNGIIRRDNLHSNIYQNVGNEWFDVVVLGGTVLEEQKIFIVEELLKAINHFDRNLSIDGGNIEILGSPAAGYANSGYINIETGSASGTTDEPKNVGNIFLTTGSPNAISTDGGVVFAKNTTPLSDTSGLKYLTGLTWDVEIDYKMGYVPQIVEAKAARNYRNDIQFTEKIIKFIDPGESIDFKGLLQAEVKFTLTGDRAYNIPQEILDRPEVSAILNSGFVPLGSKTSENYLVRLPGKSTNQWVYGPLIKISRRLPEGGTRLEMSIQSLTGSVHRPLAIWVKDEEKAYVLTNPQTNKPVINLYPIGGGEEQIVRSAIAPVVSLTKPPWEKWHQETTRTISQFTWGFSGGQYRPIPIPWCCNPNLFELLKPFTIQRSSEIPTRLLSQPDWQILTVETPTELRRYTWAKVGDTFAILPIPWTTVIGDSGSIVPEFVLIKTEEGSFDDPTNTTETQFVRSDVLPTISATRYTWEYWIFDNGSALGMLTHAKIGDLYVPVEIPWGVSYLEETGLTQEFVLTPSGAPGDVGAANTEVSDVVVRSEDEPAIASVKPVWQIWIKEDNAALNWYTWAQVGNQYIPIRLPWTYSYNQTTRQIEPQYDLLKPSP